MKLSAFIIIVSALFGLKTWASNHTTRPGDIWVDTAEAISCESKRDNLIFEIEAGHYDRMLRITKSTKRASNVETLHIQCNETTDGLKCSDYLNVLEIKINTQVVEQSCSLFNKSCTHYINSRLEYRKRNFLGLRATESYQARCEFSIL